MSALPKTVLFLCTGNSARSILGEALMTRLGQGRFIGHSAGSQPTGQPNPFALSLLRDKGYDTAAFRSKSWDEYARSDAPPMDFIFTVCGSAAGEICPVWPGHPALAHWDLPDPAAVTGDEVKIAAAFAQTYRDLHIRISAFLDLPHDSQSPPDLRQSLTEIGTLPFGKET